MSTKQAQQIDVGMHNGRIGFTMTYTDGERATILFHHSIAKRVGEHLVNLSQDLLYLESQMAPALRDRIGVSDSSSVQLTPLPTRALGIQSQDELTTDDQ